MKEAVSVRLDADVLAWLKSKGPGYQTRLNRLLRELMMKEHHRRNARGREQESALPHTASF